MPIPHSKSLRIPQTQEGSWGGASGWDWKGWKTRPEKRKESGEEETCSWLLHEGQGKVQEDIPKTPACE